ncbi:MAG: hypothetical protein GF399_03095 [Candidatus Coatesbacteria bacterium]|jgi:uncharacterized membrane protein|nr:hypothetical protein [Candidatus Coatesbacteria bacterium]
MTELTKWLAFLFGGAVSGAIIAYAMDFRTRKAILQGALGGVIVAVLYLLT